MGTYQYYEFIAIDRPLTREEQQELRNISSRAEISPTRFVNTYNFGDLSADPDTLLERYFDARIYVSNFGVRQFGVRVPLSAIDPKRVEPYLGDSLTLRVTKQHAVFTFESHDEGGEWIDDDEGTGWLESLLPIRSQLLRGDYSSLYLAWLEHATLNSGDQDEDDDGLTEPPVPAGLKALSTSHEALIEFLEISPDLVSASAEESPDDLARTVSPAVIAAWIAKRGAAEKNDWLARVANGEGALVQGEILRVWGESLRAGGKKPKARAFAQIAVRAKEHRMQRTKREAEARKKEKLAEEKAVATARKTRLDALAKGQPAAWKKVDALLAEKKAGSYAEAMVLLVDLRALADRERETEAFTKMLAERTAKMSASSAMLKRIRAAKLG